MREDLEQQEQMAALKAFWGTYGKLISLTLSMIILVSASFTAWDFYKQSRLKKASELLLSLEQNIENQKIESAILIIDELEKSFPNFLQRGLGGLILSKALVFDDRKDDAEVQLRKLINHKDLGIYWVARIRLAGLLLDMNKPAEAIDILPESSPENWSGIVNDRRGDVFLALGKKDNARGAWIKALEAYSKDSADIQATKMVERKIATINSLQLPDSDSKDKK